MARKRNEKHTTTTYARSYLITLGAAFVALCIFVLVVDESSAASWSLAAVILFTLLLVGGLGLAFYGLIGPSSKMEAFAEVASRHEASLILMVLAYPVYLAISPFYKDR